MDQTRTPAARTAATPTTLLDLAKRINDEHRLCTRYARAGLAHALRAGRLLLEAKRRCVHGEWRTWLVEHFDASATTAQVYMRVAKHWKALKGKTQATVDLTLEAALAALTKPRKGRMKPKDPEAPEAPEDQADDLGNGTFAEAYRAFRREVARTKTDGFERVSRKAVQRHLRLLAMMVGGRIETATHERTENWRLAELVERLVTLADVPPSELALGDLRQTAKDIGEIVLGPEGDGRVELTTECAA